ncbi:hypothetical protein PCURB6_35890 [Paenibacillus curdlanolyticus]|nr:hypothetical protein PCURB6_35890 [Paenibacillus curdlanolyticus]
MNIHMGTAIVGTATRITDIRTRTAIMGTATDILVIRTAIQATAKDLPSH